MNHSLQESKSTINKPIKNIRLFSFEKTTNYVITIWFWRKLASYGYYHSRCINIGWYYKVWEKNKTQPFFGYRDNGAKKENGDTCFDGTIGLGYLLLNYVNWNL